MPSKQLVQAQVEMRVVSRDAGTHHSVDVVSDVSGRDLWSLCLPSNPHGKLTEHPALVPASPAHPYEFKCLDRLKHLPRVNPHSQGC